MCRMPRQIDASDESGLPPYVSDTVITVGTFDGVHRGHRDVVERLVARSRHLKIPSVLVTFEPHPLEVVNPAAAPLLLTTHDEKLEVLAETGIDYLAVVAFTAELAAYSAEDFVELILRRRFRLRELLIGYDHGFGRQRAGNVAVLRTLGERDGFQVDVVDATGAGDAFAGGFIAGVWHGWELEKTARFANAVGALSVTGLGASCGVRSLSETLSFMENAPLVA